MDLKIAAATVTALGILAGSVLTIDGRYAHADEVKAMEAIILKTLSEQRQSLRSLTIEDNVFTLEFKVQSGTATPLDRALLERFKRERELINRGGSK